MTDTADAATTAFAPVYVELVRIHNFRGISACELEFEANLTLLVGRNNAGKSRVLRAAAIALGGVPAELDDLTVGNDAPATIDVIVAPFPPPTSETVEEVFADAVAQRLGNVQPIREEPVRERFAWRTTIRRSAEGLGARTDAQVLVFDATAKAWVLQQNAPTLSRDQRSVFAVDLVDARRDLVEEFARRGSAVRRVLSDLEVGDETRAELESQPADLGSRIVCESGTLDGVRKALEDLEKLVGSIGSPALSPLPVRLEELSRSVAIDLEPVPALSRYVCTVPAHEAWLRFKFRGSSTTVGSARTVQRCGLIPSPWSKSPRRISIRKRVLSYRRFSGASPAR